MSYGTLMVYVGLGRTNAELLRIAGDIAERFDAGVIGIAYDNYFFILKQNLELISE